jgi:class I fructose-bisphosphate aldolase
MKPSLQRILKPDGKALIVAMDHARDWGALPGIENPAEIIPRLIEAGADGIMTTYGVAKHFGHLIAGKAALIVRLDGYNSRFGEKWMAYKHWQQLYNVEDVLRHGADAVIVTTSWALKRRAIHSVLWREAPPMQTSSVSL